MIRGVHFLREFADNLAEGEGELGIPVVLAQEAWLEDHVGEALSVGAHGAEQAHGLVEVGDDVGDFEDSGG